MPSLPVDLFDPGASRPSEWLLTNGLGGFAMGTGPGVNTRRYHGLLIAAAAPPVRRILALHSTVDQLAIGDRRVDLCTQLFGHDVTPHPDGWMHLAAAEHDPPHAVQWSWAIDSIVIGKRVELVAGRNAVRVTYRISGQPNDVVLRVRPMTPLRRFHDLDHEGAAAHEAEIVDESTMRVRRDEHVLELQSSAGGWRLDPDWWRDYAYPIDRDRGQDWREDVFSPGVLEWSCPARREVSLVLDIALREPIESVQKEESEPAGDAMCRLRLAAGQFVVRRDRNASAGVSVLAGYPWFADWGRDAMISLPGLFLSRGQYAEARTVLGTFAGAIRHGLIPNRFDDDGGEPHYNTVDASLWFVYAVKALRERSPDHVDAGLIHACRQIVTGYRVGTDFGIRMDDDGLITSGDETTQLTWMDAKRESVVFTPRHGKAVEINGLWYAALIALAAMTPDTVEQGELRELAGRVSDSFRERFWWPQRECLHDVLLPDGGDWRPDWRLRPNQVIALAVAPSLLPRAQQVSVLQVVREALLTPHGLRTLEPGDPGYRGRYEGDMMQRDAAYHNGTVWPWLIGPFCTLHLQVDDSGAMAKQDVRDMVQPLLDDLDSGCVGQLAEIYDGDPPHHPHGCPAQAWSVAEVLRVLTMVEGENRGDTEARKNAASAVIQ